MFNASDITPRGDLKVKTNDPKTFKIKPIRIIGGFDKYSFVKRFKREGQYGNTVARLIRDEKPDIVINANTPIAAYSKIYKAIAKVKESAYFLDAGFYSIAASKIFKEKKIGLAGSIVGSYFTFLERKIAASADAMVLITEEFKAVLDDWKIDSNKISVIPNWSPIEELPQK